MKCEILVVVEPNGGDSDRVDLDLVACAAKIAGAKGWTTGVLLAGFDVAGNAARLACSGVDRVFVLEDARLEGYNPALHVAAIACAVRDVGPRLVLLPHVHVGLEIAAGLSVQLGAPVVSNCRSVEVAEGGLVFCRPILGGRYIATVEALEGVPVVATVSGEARLPRLFPEGAQASVERLPAVFEAKGGVRVVKSSRSTSPGEIERADVIVAVGRGIRGPENLHWFRELARALGGALAASRPVVDSGWLGREHQVGLSGATVQPKVYLAFGISGAAQHVAGMNRSKLIIAINDDPEAPIFRVAHCGVVADVFELLPALLKKARSAANASPSAG
ncbi:MAG TPA: electron transfer flavoprotein subunit alpha/FixB family protein [candidate division Zixibacteria bacterium]|nr:electron transfer flavoprotein subunit alpha/FixB family protein [candidate division Zixibacteria bacterium]